MKKEYREHQQDEGRGASTLVESMTGKKVGFERRDFLKFVALGTLSMSAAAPLAGCGSKAANADEPQEAAGSNRPATEIVVNGEGELTLAELNAFRKEYVAAQVAYTCADGTVIPEIYVKVRALINTYGFGVGSEYHDGCFDEFMYLFSEEDAQAYLDMPYGVLFSATDYAAHSGRDEEECLAICEDFASRALLYRVRRAGVPYFHQLAEAHGLWEYRTCGDDNAEYQEAHEKVFGADAVLSMCGTDVPFFYVIPTSKEVVQEGELILHDDYTRLVENNTVFGLALCQCGKAKVALGVLPPEDKHPLERCLVLGEQAEYYIENGFAREITKEEAFKILEDCADMGMVFQSAWTKEPEVICNCHSDCCKLLGAYAALGENWTKFNTSENISRYLLQYDKDECIKCGACIQRCPMVTISFDDEGYPAVGPTCVRCGQCGTVCPKHARTLTQKDQTDVAPLSQSLLDDFNKKAEYRVRNGILVQSSSLSSPQQ